MKKLMILSILMSFLLALSSCQLATDDIELTPVEEVKHLVGIYLEIRNSNSPTISKLLPEYGEEGAVYFLNATIYNNGTSTTVFDDISYGFIDIKQNIHINDNIVDGITTRTVTLDTKASLIFSPAVEDKIVDLIPILEGDTRPSGDGAIGHMMRPGVFVESKFQDEYEKDGVIYIVIFTVSLSIIDELMEVNLIEMSDENVMIQKTIFDEPVSTFEASNETAYVIIEEVYKNSQNELYTKRTIYDRGQNHLIPLRFFDHPLMIINDQKLSLSFKS